MMLLSLNAPYRPNFYRPHPYIPNPYCSLWVLKLFNFATVK